MAWYVGRVPGESDANYNAAVKSANGLLGFLGGFIALVIVGVAVLAYFSH